MSHPTTSPTRRGRSPLAAPRRLALAAALATALAASTASTACAGGAVPTAPPQLAEPGVRHDATQPPPPPTDTTGTQALGAYEGPMI